MNARITKFLIYGQWAGNEKGVPENPYKCIASVYHHKGMIEAQCSRKRGYGPHGLFCKQHGAKAEKNPQGFKFKLVEKGIIDG